MARKHNATGTDADLNLATMAVLFTDESKAREFLESKRWPNGPVCPHCGHVKVYVLTAKPDSREPVRPGVYKCGACRKQFTVRIGTIFEESKIPLRKWLMAIHLMTSSKKGISSHQIAREVGITQKSGWFLCHRIREAICGKSRWSDCSKGPWRLMKLMSVPVSPDIRERASMGAARPRSLSWFLSSAMAMHDPCLLML